jgi:drug/metabolite transporter (DMT)-like permease
MISLFLIFIGHTAYGITNTLWYNPRNTIGTLPLIMIRSLSCFILFITSHYLLDYLQFIESKNIQIDIIFSTIQICIINYFGLFFFLLSLKHTKVSNTIGFSKIGLIFGITIGFFVYNEHISVAKIITCLFIIIAISLIEKSIKTEKVTISKGLIYTFLSRFFWSSAFLFVPFINKLGILLFCSILEAVVFLMSIILYIFSNKETMQKITHKTKKEIILLILLGTIGTFCLNFAVSTTKSIIIFAFLGLIEPIVGLVVSKFYHNEKLNKLQLIGIIIGLLASVLLSLS